MNIALIFGYGQRADGAIDEQTTNRCDKAVGLWVHDQIDKIYLTVSAGKAGVAMAEMMRLYLVCRGIPSSIITIDCRGGNTAGEMDVFISAVGKMSARDRLVFISTWYHIPRIVWLAVWRQRWGKPAFEIAWRYAHLKADVLKEFLKLANAVLRPLSSSKILAKGV